MGKYMKKSKITGGGVAVMEVSQSATLATTMGVLTRAKTLALQRLQSQPQPPPSNPDKDSSANASSCYLQLRSRRLEKPQQQQQPVKRKENVDSNNTCDELSFNSNSSSKRGSRLTLSSASANPVDRFERQGRFGKKCQDLGSKFDVQDLCVEASFGENFLDFETWERSTRESTPCSLIRDPDTIRTPGSTTRPSNSNAANPRLRNDTWSNIPTSHEMEDFFACVEQQQQSAFIQKYNFDIMNDVPLPGRYDWQVIP